MVKEEFLIISVLVLQVVSTLVSLKRVLKSRCISVLDIEKNIQGTSPSVSVDR